MRILVDTVPIKISPRYAFVALLAVGTPPQMMRCLVDTGSAETWVPSARCLDCAAENSFNATLSSTFVPTTLPGNDDKHMKVVSVEMNYGTGRIVGFVVEDTVVLGSTQVPNTSFVIVEEADLPRHKMWDGIVGLGWSGLQTMGQPIYGRLQQLQQRAMFTIIPATTTDASLFIGEVPMGSVEADTLVWVEAQDLGREKRTFWTVSGTVEVGSSRWQASFILDTGTNMVMMTPAASFTPLLTALLGKEHVEHSCYVNPSTQAGDVLCDCWVVEDPALPALQVVFAGRGFGFSVRELFLRVPTEDGGERCLLEIQPNSILFDEVEVGINVSGALGQQPPHVVAGTKMAGVQCRDSADKKMLICSSSGKPTPRQERRLTDVPDDVELGLWMLGGMFMARYVTVFDFDNAKVGFAERALPPEPITEVLPWIEEVAVHKRSAGVTRLADQAGFLAGAGSAPAAAAAGVGSFAALLSIAALGLRRIAAAVRPSSGSEEDEPCLDAEAFE